MRWNKGPSAGISSAEPFNINTMKFQKILSLFCVAFLGLAASASAAGDGWMTDFEAAKVKAKAENKPLWLLLAELSPEEWVRAIDFRYITDALTQDEALDMLRALEPTRQAMR